MFLLPPLFTYVSIHTVLLYYDKCLAYLWRLWL